MVWRLGGLGDCLVGLWTTTFAWKLFRGGACLELSHTGIFRPWKKILFYWGSKFFILFWADRIEDCKEEGKTITFSRREIPGR